MVAFAEESAAAEDFNKKAAADADEEAALLGMLCLLCYAMLCYATLRYATLCYAMLCYGMQIQAFLKQIQAFLKQSHTFDAKPPLL